ncbi:putative FlgJ-related protein [Rhizobium sp. BK077]|uniref:glucosaminidase domain-containing protein n=1 Tax=unclassified Rhizobium TaxID=2613769 RepID=UPI0006471158|nr:MULTISPECIES: glucosaminidase domain-containing protein [unclassified Rhizobium]MBB3302808.1 putative FlgJ-related protein [Rhizobium sp. BK112]MBB3371781.1 putative FlgJ-related protein [Rhizobium sp. BK077]MBB4182552.1 putative FlgJ-related protein [Rhizobium sp. BK109]
MNRIAIGAAAVILAAANVSHAADDIDRPGKGDWCYLAVHAPTLVEQKSFVEEVAKAAKISAEKYGVPGAMIASMAVVESGYGLTRIAIKSNNIFAFKWPGAEIGKGYEKFVLWCQPDWDDGNEYPAFKTRADAVNFVAWRLANSRHYKPARDAYQEALKSGIDKRTAAMAWLKSIASTYNYDGTRYVSQISAIVKRPIPNSSISMWEMTE